jgi:hypothetical protein
MCVELNTALPYARGPGVDVGTNLVHIKLEDTVCALAAGAQMHASARSARGSAIL